MTEAEPTGFRPPVYPYERLRTLREKADAWAGGLVDLSIGNPTDPPEPDVVRALASSGAERGYPMSAGSRRYREAASAWMSRRLGVSVDPDQVFACLGAKEFVATLPQCHTGRYLARILDRDAVAVAAEPRKRARKKAS